MVDRKTAVHESISDEALVHLKSYKYSAVDQSPVSNYILKHYWNWFVTLLPIWLAPNMVTLLGFFFILGNVGLLVMMIPDLTGPAPSWVYYSFAMGIWMYQTMDNVDGKQARRTGTSSGLGELFDHGIDSLNCTLAPLLEAAGVGLGSTPAGAFTAMVSCLPMFFSTWETYHTHTLYLGYFNGPTEGIILACLIIVFSGIYGPGVYHQPLASLLNLPSSLHFLAQYSIVDIWVPGVLAIFFLTHLPFCTINVIKARRSRNEPLLPVFLQWIPIIVYSAACVSWLGSPYSHLLRDNHLVLFCLTQSLVFGRMTTKIILAHLTRQPFPYWTVLMAPLVLGACLTNSPRVGGPQISAGVEYLFLWGYFVMANVVYFRWAYLVINAICGYLDINCFTIPEEKLRKLEAQKAK